MLKAVFILAAHTQFHRFTIVNSLHSNLPSSGYMAEASSNPNQYRQVPEREYSITGYSADDPEHIDTNENASHDNMFSWLTDMNILTAIAEDILGPVIEESVKRKKGSQYPSNRFPATRENKKYKNTGNNNRYLKNGPKRKKYQFKKQNPLIPKTAKRPVSLVERLQNDLTQLFSAISMNFNPQDRISTSFRNKMPTFPPGQRWPAKAVFKDKDNLHPTTPAPTPLSSFPLPLSPIFPVDTNSPFSPGLQTLMQYAGLIVGGALILAIPE